MLGGGCQTQATVDGWPLGAQIPCAFRTQSEDADLVIAEALTQRFGVAAAAEEGCYFPGDYTVNGGPMAWEGSPGGIELHVFLMADGTRRVVAISCYGLQDPQPGQPVPPSDCQVVGLPESVAESS